MDRARNGVTSMREWGFWLRFNDIMQTVLAADYRSSGSAVTLWRQCVDLLAQHDRYDRVPMAQGDRDALLERLTLLRSRLSEVQRIATVVELGGRLRSASLIRFFADDRPAIAAAAMARAQLSDPLWADLLPQLGPTARGVLRGRRDMGPETRQGLEAFGSTDLVLTADAGASVVEDMLLTPDMAMADQANTDGVGDDAPLPAAPAEAGPDQIRNLVDRITRFTSNRRAPEPATVPASPSSDPLSDPRFFAFETDASGTLVWVDQGPRAALIGLSLGDVGLEGASGPDGHVAGAFQRRSGFQNGRFTIVGGGMAGEWRMSATPFFDPRSGRFQGYRGQARRPYLHEVASAPQPASATIAGLSADSLRQLVHELRTPLNAILGFAEIIEQELFGAAGPEYREMAGNIAVDARHLLAAFDDLDLAAKVSRGDGATDPQSIDPALLVMQVAARFRDQAGDAAAHVDISVPHNVPEVCIDPVQGERMVQHLLRTLVSVTPAGETVTGSCWFQPDAAGGRVILAIDRPSALVGMEESHLLDPGYTPDGDWADGPLLGLGFSLRLIRSLAAACGGGLEVEPARFLLTIPAMGRGEDAAGNA